VLFQLSVVETWWSRIDFERWIFACRSAVRLPGAQGKRNGNADPGETHSEFLSNPLPGLYKLARSHTARGCPPWQSVKWNATLAAR